MTGQPIKPSQKASSSSSSSSSSNVRVVARIRPLAQYEIENGSKPIVKSLPSVDSLSNKENSIPQISSEPEVLEVQSSEKRWFELDAVLDGNSSQREVYYKSGAQQAVTQDIFKGFNCTILAYGQTGAGKTFTMGTASGKDSSDTDGIIPRACADLFEQIDTRCDGNAQVELSYLEIYNEEIRDLMCTDGSGGDLKIRETLNGEVYVSGLSSRPVQSPKEIGHYMEEASHRRVVASTKMNAVSSRSHAICVLRIQGVLEDSTKFSAKLTLVDLAGSERIKKTQASGKRAAEGININKGLFVLGQVVSALSEQRPKYKRKPPYRDSKLTRLLQDSLGGNSRTIMVACVSPADFNIDETINTLRYATSARNIKNSATRNVIKALSPEEAAKLQRENQLLLAQVKELQETIRKMALASSEATPSLVSTDTDSLGSQEDDDDSTGVSMSSDHLREDRSKQKKRIKELEREVRHLQRANSNAKSGVSSQITETMAQEAIELPVLHKKVAQLEEELASKKELEAENEALRQEMDDLKADADSARLAANKMAKIMEQLQELKGDEVDKKKMEHDHIKVEEAWVSFVFQVLETNKEQMKRLRDDFTLVARVVESPDVMVIDKSSDGSSGGFWKRMRAKDKKKDSEDEASGDEIHMKVDPAIRQKLVTEHLQFFEERMIEMESHVHSETVSLGSIRDSLRMQRDKLEIEIGESEFERDVLNPKDNDLLNQLTTLLIGPVKNLGEYD
ncbi:kinesin motor domain containing protein [Nitzschia inconspicua]|uniref:Kinesin-like protein n=1 Tax=Nitzschia inconspicua TaxID=303405 RepID=A0A9K3KHP0_9STRA|nr:kinesin motor domain containing protein [Nitzschia inconspicua]